MSVPEAVTVRVLSMTLTTDKQGRINVGPPSHTGPADLYYPQTELGIAASVDRLGAVI